MIHKIYLLQNSHFFKPEIKVNFWSKNPDNFADLKNEKYVYHSPMVHSGHIIWLISFDSYAIFHMPVYMKCAKIIRKCIFLGTKNTLFKWKQKLSNRDRLITLSLNDIILTWCWGPPKYQYSFINVTPHPDWAATAPCWKSWFSLTLPK